MLQAARLVDGEQRKLEWRDVEIGSVMLVGHNPGIEDLAAELSGGGDPDERAALEAKYPTGGVATLAFEGAWRELDWKDATLEAFAVPRRLG